MAKAAQDPPSPVDAYEAPPPPLSPGELAPLPRTSVQQVAATRKANSGELNDLAVIALIASCFGLTIPGIVMGHIALSQIKKSGETGYGLALAAVIVGYALTALIVLAVVAFVIFMFAVIGVAGSAVSDFGNLG